jgi:hypothetical protein
MEGINLFDLTPPADGPLYPATDQLRHPERIPPQPRYVPPPLPDGYARVELDDDYDVGPVWNDWAGQDAGYPARVFDIPAEQRDRWDAARAAYAAMQEEISALREDRLAVPGFAPPGWERKGSSYQVQP